ncbi:MAG: translational repressor RegA [Candidatus Levybacteria bacterium]|nr:translational repressor RegA [Candidatus Levybacteria bacterium]
MNTQLYNDVFKHLGVEINIKDNDFLKIKETLTRIGIASNRQQVIYQSCHILHKRGMYGILHFKELFILDNKSSNIDESDYARRDYITKLLADWNLVKIDPTNYVEDVDKIIIKHLKILPFSEKANWTLISKYKIGK